MGKPFVAVTAASLPAFRVVADDLMAHDHIGAAKPMRQP